MNDGKKKWIQPQLIILSRGTPEENVLASCKASTTGVTPSSLRDGCKKKSGRNCTGGQCNIISSS